MVEIAVTGANGQIGREVARAMQAAHLHGRLLVRDPAKAAFLEDGSSQILQFDFNHFEGHKKALEGVKRLFLNCASSVSEEAIAAFLDRATSLEKIVIMSGIGAETSEHHFLRNLENAVKQRGIPFASMRANWFYQNFSTHFRGMIRESHLLALPDGHAAISFVDARDIAEVVLHFLTTEEEGMYDIAGPESLTHADVAALFSKHLPFEVGYKELSEEEAVEQLGWNAILVALFRDIRNRLTAPVSDVVPKILGKPARTLEGYIVENLQVWTDSSLQ